MSATARLPQRLHTVRERARCYREGKSCNKYQNILQTHMYIPLKINFAIMCASISSSPPQQHSHRSAFGRAAQPKSSAQSVCLKKGHPVKEPGTIKALQSADHAACAALGALHWAGSGGAGGSACFGKWRRPGAERGGLSAVGSAIGVSGLGSDICI